MAKNYVYNQKTNTRFAIKGELTFDGKTIQYENSDKEEATIALSKCFEPFKGKFIELSISVKENENLEDLFENGEA